MKRIPIAATLLAGVALVAASASAQQAAKPLKPADKDITPTKMRLPDLDKGETVTITGMVPIPNVGDGAPLFTALDLKTMSDDTQKAMTDIRREFRRCGGSEAAAIIFDPRGRPTLGSLLGQEFEAQTRVAAAAGKAQLVTQQAEDTRRGAALGTVPMRDVEAAELERQQAIAFLQKARAELVEAQAMTGDFQNMALGEVGKFGIEWSDLDVRSLSRQKEGVGLGIAVPEEFKTLAIRNVQANQVKDRKGKDVVIVRGELANSGRWPAAIPSLSVSLVDNRGWVMVNQTVESTGALWRNIGAGKSKQFEIEVRPAPELLETAVVTFAAKHAAKPRLGVGAFCGGLAGALSFQQNDGSYFDNSRGNNGGFPPVRDGYPG